MNFLKRVILHSPTPALDFAAVSKCTLNDIQTSYHSYKELGCLAPACFSKLNKYSVITYSVSQAQWSTSWSLKY